MSMKCFKLRKTTRVESYNKAKTFTLGFISITQYRDIDRGIGDPAIIITPRDRTISVISRMKSLTRPLINSSQGTHRVITTRSVTGRRDRGQSATGRHQVTAVYTSAPATLRSLDCHLLISKYTISYNIAI